MKKLLIILLCLSIIAIALGCSPVAKPDNTNEVADLPPYFIKQDGVDLLRGNEKFLMYGVNFGGWLLTEDWFTPTSSFSRLDTENGQYEYEKVLSEKYGVEETKALIKLYRDNWITEQDFINVKKIGFNTIRLPFGWDEITDREGNTFSESFVHLDYAVKMCEKYGLYLIIDLHGAYGSQNGRHHSGDTTTGGDLYGNEINEELTIKLWSMIAERYADKKVVAAYDLLNEPEGEPDGMTTTIQFEFYDRLYKKIREVDPEHLIIMEACWDVSDLPDPHKYGWENVAYEVHYYNWGSSGDLESTQKYLAGKVVYHFLNNVSYKVPLLVGEFNSFDSLESWDYELNYFFDNNMSWTMWTYKGMVGGNWTLYMGSDRTLENIVYPDIEYQKAKSVFECVKTEDSFVANDELIAVIKRCIDSYVED